MVLRSPSARGPAPHSAGVLIALLFCLPAVLQAESLTVTPDRDFYSLHADQARVLRDSSGQLQINDVRSGNTNGVAFQETDSLSFGYTTDVIWVRFNLENQRAEEGFFLQIPYPVLDRVDLYAFAPDGAEPLARHSAGDSIPFPDLEVSSRALAFELPVAPGDRLEVYLRVRTESAVSLPIQIATPKAFADRSRNEQTVLMLYYGAVAMMFLYNVSLFVYLRDRSYLYYVLYIFSAAMVFAVQNGIAYQYFWPQVSWLNDTAQSTTVLMAALFIVVFCRSFLQTRASAPRLNKILYGWTFIIGICAAVSLFAPVALALRIASLGVVISALLAISAGVAALLKGFIIARFYLLAWGVLLTGGVLSALHNFGILPYNAFTAYGAQFGSALEVLLLSFGLGYRINLLRAEKEAEKREITESVSRFVPTEFLSYLGATDIRQIQFGSYVEQIFTVLFTDIRNFTGLSEKMTVEENFRFLNSYLKRMVPQIHRNDGIIDKFIGDAILALFAGPAHQAVKAAVDLRRELTAYNEYRTSVQGYVPLETGIGLHTGRLMLGTLGFDKKTLTEGADLKVPEKERDRLDTTVIGDTVNVAARLQELTKVYGTRVLISESVFNDMPPEQRAFTREVDQIRLRGRERDMRIYETFEGDPEATRQRKTEILHDYTEARKLFLAGEYGDALRDFIRIKEHCPEDPLTEYFLQRCRERIQIGSVAS